MTANNEPIGTCPCPIPKCDESCAVKRFQARHTKDTGKRYAGKLYLICKLHGRLGMDGAQGMQDYIIDNGHLFNADELKPKAEAAPAPATAAAAPIAPAKPTAAPAAAEQPKPRSGFADWEW